MSRVVVQKYFFDIEKKGGPPNPSRDGALNTLYNFSLFAYRDPKEIPKFTLSTITRTKSAADDTRIGQLPTSQ